VKTALAMQRAVAHMNREKEWPDGLQIRVGIGINTGDMIVGNMGSESRFDYTVIGDNVNLASRLESLTKEYGVGILASDATIKDIADKILSRRIDRVAVKGKTEPVTVREILGIEGQVAPKERKLAADFEAALDAYFARDFDAAIARCEAIRKTWPDDGPCATLIDRATHMKTHAPPPDWNGVWVMHTK
jgi:adenylate cyclase